ncbi:MAG: DUF1501 domain-containing protein [Deltaproteobacteria bacterium]|nr:DUF1501 domain-containing protein [Deltaproteobacteria bacterium]
MALTRRQFLQRTGALTAGSILAPGFFRTPLLRHALAAIDDRFFVVVFLDGGNDGLNTVVPLGDAGPAALRTAYEAARATGTGGLRLSTTALTPLQIANDLNTGTPLALHPGLVGLKNLYDLGKVAVVQGVGYPDYSGSHAEARTAWRTANPLGLPSVRNGWLGRYLADNYGSSNIPGVNIEFTVAGEFEQQATTVLTLERLQYFLFPFDQYNLANDYDPKKDAHLALASNAAASLLPVYSYLGTTGSNTLLATESYQSLHGLYTNERPSWNSAYSALDGNGVGYNGFARDLREVAKVIYGVKQGVSGVTSRFFEVSNSGYDTHSDQGTDANSDQHFRLHRRVGDAIEVFYQDLEDMGLADKVCILVWSEFGRRILQNDNGTDHGSQGPAFVIGGAVNGGVYGNHPNINGVDSGAPQALDDGGNTPYSQAANNLADLTLPFRSTDLRDVYGTIIKHWLNLDDSQAQGLLPLDTGSADEYWTVPNFDLGFL